MMICSACGTEVSPRFEHRCDYRRRFAAIDESIQKLADLWEWRAVADHQPPKRTPVLAVWPSGRMRVVNGWPDRQWASGIGAPTHWRALPPPPEAK